MKRNLQNVQQKKLMTDSLSKKNYAQVRVEKILKSAMVKKMQMEKKELKSIRKQKGKERRRKIRTYLKLNNLFKSFILNTTDKDEQQKFIEKYGHLFVKDRIYTPYERKLLSGMKAQRVLRRKRYRPLTSYKWQKLDTNKVSHYWDLFEHRKVKTHGSCSFVEGHSNKIYTLKRVLRFFYGYLKNNVWRGAYLKSKRRKNKVLSFLNLLENRLVVVLFRMNLALSLMQAKQFIRHGFVKVNGKKVIYRNFQIKKNDIISVDRKMFLNFLLGNKTLPLNFMFSSVIKPELPHLYVKHRLLTGIFLYDPLNNYNVLAKQHPSFFFGKDRVQYEHMNFHKISKNARSFTEYKNKKKHFARHSKSNPFTAKYNEIFANVNDNIPLKNVKLVLSYFLRT